VLLQRIDFDGIAFRKGLIKKASPFVERSIKGIIAMDKHNPTVYETIANLRFFEGRYQEALSMIKIAESLKPDYYTYALFEADLFTAMNDRKTALEIYKKLISKLDNIEPPPSEWVHAKFGIVYQLMFKGDLDEAMIEIDSVIKRIPHIAQAYVIKGDIYAAQKKYEQAQKAFSTAQTIEPNNPFAKRGLEQLEKIIQKR